MHTPLHASRSNQHPKTRTLSILRSATTSRHQTYCQHLTAPYCAVHPLHPLHPLLAPESGDPTTATPSSQPQPHTQRPPQTASALRRTSECAAPPGYHARTAPSTARRNLRCMRHDGPTQVQYTIAPPCSVSSAHALLKTIHLIAVSPCCQPHPPALLLSCSPALLLSCSPALLLTPNMTTLLSHSTAEWPHRSCGLALFTATSQGTRANARGSSFTRCPCWWSCSCRGSGRCPGSLALAP